MKKNMGSTDRIIRFVLAVIIAVLIFTKQIAGAWAVVLGIFAVIFVITSFVNFCPLYVPLKISTHKKK